MNPRRGLVAVLLVAILGFTVTAIAQGQGEDLAHEVLWLLGGAVAFGLIGAGLMLRWTASFMFWSGFLEWFRRRR